MLKNVPNNEDWGDYRSDLDLHAAFKMFAGKTNEDMQIEFKSNVTERSNDFMYMPKIPFQYYIFGFKKYIDRGDFPAGEQDEAVVYFVDTIIFAIKNHPDYVNKILEYLMPTLQHIADNQVFYQVDTEIYGDCVQKVDFIKKYRKKQCQD